VLEKGVKGVVRIECHMTQAAVTVQVTQGMLK
jgi:hypothetical protein